MGDRFKSQFLERATAHVGHGNLERRMRMQNEESETLQAFQSPVGSRFLNSAFAFCVLSFCGQSFVSSHS
jgi:hypothetical protein